MKSTLDCIPCFVSQALKVLKLASQDNASRERILRKALYEASLANLSRPPIWFGHWLHRLIREETGTTDPYQAIKERSNQLALQLLPIWRERLREKEEARSSMVKLVIAANVIDFGVKGDLTAESIPVALEESFSAPFRGDIQAFFQAAEQAADILFLADNAGELVFDRLLLEMLPVSRTTVVVKGGPAINDALRADATAAQLDGWIEIIDTGVAGAGVLLESSSAEFLRRFSSADLVIAKGQANFESLEGCNKDIFFLFKVKCPIVGQHVGHPVGTLVLHRNTPEHPLVCCADRPPSSLP